MVEGCNAAQCGNTAGLSGSVWGRRSRNPYPFVSAVTTYPAVLQYPLSASRTIQYHPDRLPSNRKRRSVVVCTAPPLLLFASTSDSNLQIRKVMVTASHQLKSTYIDSGLPRKPTHDGHELRRKFLTPCKLGTRYCVFSIILMRARHCHSALALRPSSFKIVISVKSDFLQMHPSYSCLFAE